MSNELKEVRFDVYCPTCKYFLLPEYEEPCNGCLCIPAMIDSHKPEYYEPVVK